MKEEKFYFPAEDGKDISAIKWLPDNESSIKAIIQLNHGMAEHKERYFYFAEKLVNEGFVVYIHDHRGHGNTAKNESEIGHFADKNGWNKVVKDIHTLSVKIKNDYPNLPFFLFGHSMGSVLVRDYITMFNENLSGVILSGTAQNPKLLGKIGIKIAKIEEMRLGKKGKSKLLNALTFGDFNKKFKPKRTDFDWLSRDNEQVDKYINDPLCGFICSTKFFQDMIKGTIDVNNKNKINNINKELPIYIISGSSDPVGGYGKGVKEIFDTYKNNGIGNTSFKLYKNGRHELLNEVNREEIINDLILWMSSKF
jgi:alpha-beta hydrolase superfamily lysophospholipase